METSDSLHKALEGHGMPGTGNRNSCVEISLIFIIAITAANWKISLVGTNVDTLAVMDRQRRKKEKEKEKKKEKKERMKQKQKGRKKQR